MKKFRIDIFSDDDVISPKIIKDIVDDSIYTLRMMFGDTSEKIEISSILHSIKKPIFVTPADSIGLIRIFFIGDQYDPGALGGKLAARGLLPNVIYILDNQLEKTTKRSLISLASQSFSQIYTSSDYNDDSFLGEYSELFHGLAVTHRWEILGKEEEEDGLITNEQLKAAADQLDFAIGAIEDLRLNTTYEIVTNLRSVSTKLRSRSIATTPTSRSDFNVLMEEVYTLASKLMDAMENKKFASIAVSGIIASVVGYIGAPAVTAMGLCMAYLQGPEIFRQFISQRNIRSSLANRDIPEAAAPPEKKRRAPRRKIDFEEPSRH